MFRIAKTNKSWVMRSSDMLRNGQFQRTMVTVNGEELFDKILIANRGEIACRVIETCRKLGIKSVAIFSEADRYAKHVQLADEAYYVGPAPSSQSYLQIQRIMDIIKETGAQAVHPGYGFLSENHLFAEALEKQGVSFIGPGSFAITSMGDKITSKKLAAEAGVSTIPGNLALVEKDEDIIRIANEIGYPVMIKASAGGGGKGMRIAYNDKEAIEGFKLSREEARASFGDDRMFIEKFVEEPRHIEIQIIADKHGNVAALPERECSIQRRNQKVLEEAPSTFIDPETRKKMQAEAIMLAKAVDYCSAGTVEMLVDKHRNFYFLEMNTRLQVEHPVTELVAGVDLVEQMIRVAAGHKLPADLLDPNRPILGWAHEARVYAEDPFRGFLPSIGRLIQYKEPTTELVPGVRVDTGVREGDEISVHYDPMIAKLITHGDNRAEALDRLERALDLYCIKGPGHNLNFLRAVTRHPRFRSGKITTKFIAEEYPKGFHGVELTEPEYLDTAVISSLLFIQQQQDATALSGQEKSPSFVETFVVSIRDKKYKVAPSEVEEDSFVVSDFASGEKLGEFPIQSFDYNPGKMLVRAEIDNEFKVAQVFDRTPLGFKIQYCGAIESVSILSEREESLSKHMIPKPEVDFGKWLLSPMPGTLVSVNVEDGAEVFAGQPLAVVEAMKMQNVLRAEKDGKVKKVLRTAGSTLAVDEEIIEFE